MGDFMVLPEIKRGEADLGTILFEKALEFYQLSRGEESQQQHLKITQEMTYAAVDLFFPQIQEIAERTGTLHVVAPLRGGLGLVTPETIEYLNKKLSEAGLEHIKVQPMGIGVKRHVDTMTTEVYFSSQEGELEGSAVIFDWGTATGLTNDATIDVLIKAGIKEANIMALSMTLPEEGLRYIKDRHPQSIVVAATRAVMNEKSYICGIGPLGDETRIVEVEPGDWGDLMWGTMLGNERAILDYCVAYATLMKNYRTPDQLKGDIEKLLAHYGMKYMDKNMISEADTVLSNVK
jgi:uracil phosphoribosyltransferase